MPNNSTKLALEDSLKNLLLKKPVDKITITDLTNDCGITRMAFYYHFKDIYDLVEWSCYEDASRALQGKKTYETWQEGLMQRGIKVHWIRTLLLLQCWEAEWTCVIPIPTDGFISGSWKKAAGSSASFPRALRL